MVYLGRTGGGLSHEGKPRSGDSERAECGMRSKKRDLQVGVQRVLNRYGIFGNGTSSN